MTQAETTKILAILKAAYPNSYKNMTKEEASGTVMIWATQFSNIPAEVVWFAVNQIIATKPFPPAICEVKEKIKDFYWEAKETLDRNERLKSLTSDQKRSYELILGISEQMRRGTSIEPSLNELVIGGSSRLMLGQG